jgi:hypothetical protein
MAHVLTDRDRNAYALPPNKQLQRTVMDKVPSHMGQRAAAHEQLRATRLLFLMPRSRSLRLRRAARSEGLCKNRLRSLNLRV